jgi:methyltransferase (TIGR00027 family)
MTPGQIGRLRPHLEARTRYVDQAVLAAIGRGMGQIVIVGAGYDDRALRFRSPGVRYFELDHPGTQEDKRRRLLEMGVDLDREGPVLLPADFLADDVAGGLATGGQDDCRPTLFICEGVLVYFDEPSTVTLLSQVRRRAPAGSQLVATLATVPAGSDPAVVLASVNSRRPNGASEPWRTMLPAAAQIDLMAKGGWDVVEAVDDVDLVDGAPPQRSLSITAQPA